MKETKSWRVCAKTATAARLCVDCHPQKQTECKQTNWYETETGVQKMVLCKNSKNSHHG